MLNALASIGIVWAIAMAGASGLSALSRLRHRRALRLLHASRDAFAAQARCMHAFAHVPPGRVLAAYAWVQQLVAMEGMPLHLDDDLFSGLHIPPQVIDRQIDASHTHLGRALDGGHALHQPLRTVRDVVAGVLAAGYEAYIPEVKHN